MHLSLDVKLEIQGSSRARKQDCQLDMLDVYSIMLGKA